MIAIQRKTRGLGMGLLVLSMLYLVPAQAQQYTLSNLGTLGGSGGTYGTGINASGQIVGYSDTASGAQNAFLYSNGTMANLGTLGGSSSAAYAINNAGQVVGQADTSAGIGQAFLYSNGTMSNLGTLPGNSYSAAYGINNAGVAAGFSSNSPSVDPSGLGGGIAVTFSNGKVTSLPTAGAGTPGEVVPAVGLGINDAGQVTGAAATFVLENHPFLFSNGMMRELGTFPGGGEFGGEGSGNAINASGQVTGFSSGGPTPGGVDFNDFRHAFLYSSTTGLIDLGVTGGFNASEGFGINDAGEVVGTVSNGTTSHAFLYSSGNMRDLNLLDTSSPLAAQVTLTTATAINDNGWIVADGYDSQTGLNEAFLLTPVPLPATAWLLAAGLGGLAALGRRRRAA